MVAKNELGITLSKHTQKKKGGKKEKKKKRNQKNKVESIFYQLLGMSFAIWTILGTDKIYNGKHAGISWDSLQGWERETITVKYFQHFSDISAKFKKQKNTATKKQSDASLFSIWKSNISIFKFTRALPVAWFTK